MAHSIPMVRVLAWVMHVFQRKFGYRLFLS